MSLFAGTTLVTTVSFWIPNVFLLAMDLTGQPKALTRFKVQPDKNVPLSVDKLKRLLPSILVNQLVVGQALLAVLLVAMQYRGCSFLYEELPSVWRILSEILVFAIIEEIGFYYAHRLFHQPALYKRYHKKHHEWTAPVCVVAIYAHPLEHVLANLLPAVLGPVVLGSHLITMWVWMSLVIVTTSIHHSGYHFPLLPSPEFHDFHHLKFNVNYGVLGLLDRLHGTDSLFRQSKASQRHKMLLSFTPLSRSVSNHNISDEKHQ